MSWEIKKLGDVCDFYNGKAHEKSIDENGKYKVVNSKFVSSNGEKAKRTKIAQFPLFKDDIVMVMSDVPNGKTLAKCFLIDKDDTYSLNQRVCAIRTTHFDKRFLFYQLNRNRHFLGFNNGENQTNLRKDDILNCELFVPPLQEQQHIVTILEKAFAAIEKAKDNAEQNIKNAKELFESYLQNVLEKKGKDWEEVPLGKLCKLTRGHNPPKSKFIKEPKEGYVRFYQIRDGWSDDYEVYVPNSSQLHKVSPDDMLMVAYRHIGKVFRGVSGAFNVALCKIANNRRDLLNDDFLFYIIPTNIIKGELMKRSERSLIPSMSVEHLKEIVIPLPPLKEQQTIVQKLDILNAETKQLDAIYKQKIDDLEELKKSLMQKAFNGELKTEKELIL